MEDEGAGAVSEGIGGAKQEVELKVINTDSQSSTSELLSSSKLGGERRESIREVSSLQVALEYNVQLPSDEVLYKDSGAEEVRKRVHNAQVHPDDKVLVDQGFDEDQAKALRYQRETRYANPIEGPVLGGSLSKWTLWAYAPPSLTTVPIPVLISVFVIQFYEKVGAGLGLLAFFQGLARGFDVITDPCMSYFTDSCRSKHGRRRPFLFTGAPIYSLCLIFLLAPSPGLSTQEVSVWFGVFYILFFLTSTYTSIPYDALGPELTDNEKDRSQLFFTCTMFDGFGGLAVALLPAGMVKGVSMYRKTCEAVGECERYLSCDTKNQTIDALSAAGPWINGESIPLPSLASWKAAVSNSAVDYGFDRSFCSSNLDRAAELVNASNPRDVDFVNWCKCRSTADQIFSIDSERYAFLFVGMFFGIWAFFSLWYCVYMVKERSMLGGKTLAKSKALVPAILNTFSNKPFTLLLPPAILDAFSNALITSLLTYFVRYIVQPEYSNEQEWGCKPVGGSGDWKCQSSMVLAASFLAFLTGALLFTPLWLFLANRYGKTDVWLAWSFSNGVTFLAYAFVGKGKVYLCIVMSIINGAPAGAKFLADAIMADVIDYDEFLTGSRNEATYTMFKAFLPKIAAIPASAIPIALLSSFGHIELIDGVVQEQPQSLRTFIRIMIIFMPALLSFTAWYLKTKYPLKTTRQVQMITEGVANHILGESSKDPCSNLEYKLIPFSDEELDDCDLVDTFPGAGIVGDLIKDGENTAIKLIRRCIIQLLLAIAWLVGFLAMAVGTYSLLEGELSYIPVLAIVCFGVGITAVGFTGMRLHAALKLKRSYLDSTSKLDDLLLKKLLKKRVELEEIRKFSSGLNLCQQLRKYTSGTKLS